MFPRDNQRDLIAFYGTPGPQVERQLVPVTPPWKMYYRDKPLKTIRFHRKAAPALEAVFEDIWEHYGKSQQAIEKVGLHRCEGTYNPRKVRGSATKWSNHAYGAAIDLNASENGLYQKGNIPAEVVSIFKKHGFRWGGDYRGRKDPMHFEACQSEPNYGIMGEGDNGVDAEPDDEDQYDVSPEAPKPWYKKVWSYVASGGLFGGGLAAWGFSEYLLAFFGVVAVLAFLVFLVLWFSKDGRKWLISMVSSKSGGRLSPPSDSEASS